MVVSGGRGDPSLFVCRPFFLSFLLFFFFRREDGPPPLPPPPTLARMPATRGSTGGMPMLPKSVLDAIAAAATPTSRLSGVSNALETGPPPPPPPPPPPSRSPRRVRPAFAPAGCPPPGSIAIDDSCSGALASAGPRPDCMASNFVPANSVPKSRGGLWTNLPPRLAIVCFSALPPQSSLTTADLNESHIVLRRCCWRSLSTAGTFWHIARNDSRPVGLFRNS